VVYAHKVTPQIVFARERSSAILVRTYERFDAVWVMSLHMRLEVVLSGERFVAGWAREFPAAVTGIHVHSYGWVVSW